MNYDFLKPVLLAIIIFTGSIAQAQRKTPVADKPNVIYILADDMGAGMLSYYGQRFFSTPNIDRLARDGVVFENAYSSAYCAPSRATFLTGYSDCHPGKYVLTGGGIYTKTATGQLSDAAAQEKVNAAIGKEPEVLFLPQVFKKAGYVTGEVGKLDWGFTTTDRQLKNHGWDYYYGYYDHIQCHGFYPMFLHENGRRITIPGNTHPDAAKTGEWGSDRLQEQERWNMNGKQVYSQDLFLQKMLAFIRENKNRPFFLYHPTQLPHGPVAIPAIHPELAFNDSLTAIEKAYASMVKRLDEDVAVIMEELQRLGIAEKTMIVFSSDNGHELYYAYKGRVEKPYRNMQTGNLYNDVTDKFYSGIGGDVFNANHGMAGLKRSNWNGGVKVPLFVYWPSRFQKGMITDRLVTNYDFISTIADLLQVPLKEKKDGISYLPVLQKRSAGSNEEHKAIAFASFMGPALVTNDGWKLRYYAPQNCFQLYHLVNDPREEKELSMQYPEKLRRLQQELLSKCDGDLKNGWFSDEKNIVPVQ
ncbi:MAG: sulfatase-like hydrolase/transferase [Niabella sp.]|nr:sulfatase-like hydrolase/transferase [Niabella sp.]